MSKVECSTSHSNPNLSYVKPLYYISLAAGLTVPINLAEYRVNPRLLYKLYCIAMMAAILYMNCWSFFGRLNTAYAFLIQTVIIIDVLQQFLLLSSNLYSILNVLMFGSKYLSSYFTMLKKVDAELFTKIDMTKTKVRYNLCLFAAHVVTVIISAYDYWAWTRTLSDEVWTKFGFRLYTFYLTLIIVMQLCTFSSALRCRFGVLNRHLTNLSQRESDPQRVQRKDLARTYKIDRDLDLQCLVKMHDLLCDIIELINGAFGLNILFLVCNIIINSVMAFNLTLIFGTGVLAATNNAFPVHVIALNVIWALYFVAMGVCVAWSCASSSDEAMRSATICFKLVNGMKERDRELRQELLQFVQQVEHRRPSYDAAGFFPVNFTMLYAIVGAITSYIVIVIQFNNSPPIRTAGNFTAQ